MGTKISEFAAATTPLTGAELVPVVQGGSTLKTTAGAFSTLAPVQTVAGRTGAVVIATTDVTGFTAAAAAAAPVQTVAGRTGAVTLGISDVASLQTSLDGKLSTSGGVISANSSTDALRITQTGTGNALVVEDSTNPDATPFVVTADGNVGVGTSTPIDVSVSGKNITVYQNTSTSTVADNASLALQSVNRNANLLLKSATDCGVFFGNQTSYFYNITGNVASGALLFRQDATERMRITETGNVGIGTSTPGSKLAVIGDASFGAAIVTGNSTSTADCTVEIGGARTASGASFVDLHTTAGSDFEARFGRESGANGIAQLANTGTGALELFQVGAAPIVFKTTSTERMRIDAIGNVGIGTSAPTNFGVNWKTLQIYGTSGGALRASSANVVFDFYCDETAALGVLRTASNHPIIFAPNSSEAMRISNSGNVCIGTSSAPASAAKTLCLGESNVPTANPASGGVIYVETGALKYRSAGGKITTLATNV